MKLINFPLLLFQVLFQLLSLVLIHSQEVQVLKLKHTLGYNYYPYFIITLLLGWSAAKVFLKSCPVSNHPLLILL